MASSRLATQLTLGGNTSLNFASASSAYKGLELQLHVIALEAHIFNGSSAGVVSNSHRARLGLR